LDYISPNKKKQNSLWNYYQGRCRVQNMEILKNDTDYAMRALVYLAQHQKEQRPVAVKTLAKAQDIPSNFAYKVLQRLSRAGLTKAYMGPRGGFALAKEAGQITLLKVVEAVQGPVTMRRCLLGINGCGRRLSCSISSKLEQVQGNLAGVLEDVTLADVLEDEYSKQDNIALNSSGRPCEAARELKEVIAYE